MFDYTIYTDGGYSMKENKGAYAFVILDNDEPIMEGGEKIEHETNNRCEIKAIISSIGNLPYGCSVLVKSDSQYAIGVLSSTMKAKKNQDLIDIYRRVVQKGNIKVTFEWVRGHNGDKWNEYCDQRCDEIAGMDLNEEFEKYR